MAKRRSDLLTGQALRRFAALLVVAPHSVYSAVSCALRSIAEQTWPNRTTDAGIFFTINGRPRPRSASMVAAAE